MDILTKLGGRKFLMAQIAAGVGTYMEITHGLTPTFAGFLVALVGAFSVANHMSTSAYLDSKTKPGGGSDDKLDQILDIAQKANDQESVQQIVNALNNIQTNVAQSQEASRQTGLAVVNLTKEVLKVSKAVTQPTF